MPIAFHLEMLPQHLGQTSRRQTFLNPVRPIGPRSLFIRIESLQKGRRRQEILSLFAERRPDPEKNFDLQRRLLREFTGLAQGNGQAVDQTLLIDFARNFEQ